ncbi:MAG: bifunctional adenosylcobinamide kinase/adenosylcobinamide-phosphate guanylyltransferase [Blautia sp.]|nr:bifunctional adenosylcobinamide kinase/adenosylcobinamide-phosphate guanylyltransferase [Blautia sp.]
MDMIIGGAFQGKTAYAKDHYPQVESWVNGKKAAEEDLKSAQGVLDFQEYIKKELAAGREVSHLAGLLLEENPDLVLVCQEVGYGVVPVDAFERKYREAVGRVCTELASGAKKVTRVVCGIGTVIRDA